MALPTGTALSSRRRAPFALVAAVAAVSLLFVATPFLIPEVAARYGVSEGTAATISVAQVGAFALATLLTPRLVAPSGSVLRVAAVVLVVFNLASAAPDDFRLLLVLRACAGAAGGVLTWITWTDAMRSTRSMTDIAAAGPAATLIGAPIIGLISGYGDRWLYLALAVISIPAAVARAEVSGTRRRRGVVSRSRSNRLLLAALAILVFFASALTVALVIVGRDIHGLGAGAVAVAFSINAALSMFGARVSARNDVPGLWLASTGVAAVLTVVGPAPLFFVAIAWWGMSWWMSVPGVFTMLAAHSLEPAERAGDAQGLMALGRALGPAMSAAFVDAGALVALAVVCGIGMACAGSAVVAVGAARSRRALDHTADGVPGSGAAAS